MNDRRKNDEMKSVLKEGLKEWLDEKFAQFGKWSMAGVGCMILVVMAYLFMKFAGWSPPHP